MAPEAGVDATTDGAPPSNSIAIVVDNTASTGTPTHLAVGSNQIYSVVQLATPPPSAQARLATLAPSLLRLHIHAVGGNLPTAASTIQVCPTPTDTSCNRVPWSFSALDYLVEDAKSAGAEPLMNIALPPPWQWTVTDATSTPHPTGHVTDANDPSKPFGMFASYMRSLVEYYNSGATTVTEQDGTSHMIANPSGTANRITWWELLNEPALSSPANFYQPPGPYPLTPAFTPEQYVAMWNATTAAMLAADATIKIVGPAMPFARSSFGADGGADYIPLLLKQPRTPDAISFHGYAWVDNEIPDLVAFAGDPTNAGRRGFAGIVADLHQVEQWTQAAGVPNLPIWIDEFGFNGFGKTDPHRRPNHVFGAAFSAAAFTTFAQEKSLEQLDEFSFALQAYPDLSLLDFTSNHQPSLLFWLYAAIGKSFPVGATFLPLQGATFSVQSPGLAAYAVRSKSSPNVSVLLANATVASPTDTGGPGVPATVSLQVNGGAFTHVTVSYLDATTDLDQGPAPMALAASNPATIQLPGYGVAVVELAP